MSRKIIPGFSFFIFNESHVMSKEKETVNLTIMGIQSIKIDVTSMPHCTSSHHRDLHSSCKPQVVCGSHVDVRGWGGG